MKHATQGVLTLTAIAMAMAGDAAAQERTVDTAEVTRLIASWPQVSQDAAKMIIQKYGPPAGVTENMLVWERTGPWKRTIVYREEVPHRFPMPHTDVLEQFIDYKVPADKFDELAEYDGSVIAERTKGELSARCDKEGANFLALNLAHEIITGKRDVNEARQFYGEQIMAMQAKRSAPYTERLLFTVSIAETRDPDEPIMAAGEVQPEARPDTAKVKTDTTKADTSRAPPPPR